MFVYCTLRLRLWLIHLPVRIWVCFALHAQILLRQDFEKQRVFISDSIRFCRHFFLLFREVILHLLNLQKVQMICSPGFLCMHWPYIVTLLEVVISCEVKLEVYLVGLINSFMHNFLGVAFGSISYLLKSPLQPFWLEVHFGITCTINCKQYNNTSAAYHTRIFSHLEWWLTYCDEFTLALAVTWWWGSSV